MNRIKQHFSKHFKTFLRLSIIFIISCAIGDGTPPAQIDDFSISSNEKMLKWTAPGDDGDSGRATLYLLRFFTGNQDNFSTATQISRFLIPKDAGSPELTAIPRLEISGETQFSFSIVAIDEVGNSSDPSTISSVTTKLVGANFENEDSTSCPGASASSGEFMRRDGEDEDKIINDLIIGDPCLGKVYIFIGGANIARDKDKIDVDDADVTIIGDPDDSFGFSVSGVGNLTGSASSDEFVIGAPYADGKGENEEDKGRVFVFEGGKNLSGEIDLTSADLTPARFFTIEGEAPGDKFGFEIAKRESNSFFVGAPGASSGAGKVYRFDSNNLGDQTGATVSAGIASNIITGQPGDEFGYSIVDGGQIDTSDPDEFIVGAPGGDRAYVFFDTGDFNLSGDVAENFGDVLVIEGSDGDRFGEAVGGGFNIDGSIDTSGNSFGDEYELIELADIKENADVVVSAPGTDSKAGSVFMYSNDDLTDAFNPEPPQDSKKTLDFEDFKLKIDGIEAGDQLGKGLIVIPDINPDWETRKRGTTNVLAQIPNGADIAIGAPGRNNGEVYIFFGKSVADNTVIASVISASAADKPIMPSDGTTITSFGANLDNLLDVNGDDFFDFSIGSSNALTLEY